MVGAGGLHCGVDVAIGDERFSVDCYAIPLHGFDMVLGVQWWRALGPIVWDFDWLSMSFWWYDRHVTWHGVAPPLGAPHVHTWTA